MTIERFGTFSQSVQSLLSVRSHIDEISLPLFLFIEEEKTNSSGSSNYQGTAQLIYHRFTYESVPMGRGGWEMVADLFILNNHNNNKKIISNYLFLLGCRGLSYRVAIEQYLHIFKRLERVPLVLISCWLFVSLNLAKIVRAGKYRVSE